MPGTDTPATLKGSSFGRHRSKLGAGVILASGLIAAMAAERAAAVPIEAGALANAAAANTRLIVEAAVRSRHVPRRGTVVVRRGGSPVAPYPYSGSPRSWGPPLGGELAADAALRSLRW
jgi:hypothetical protein